MTPRGEYRCPHCLKDGKTGLLLAWEQIGIRYEYGMLFPEMPDDPLRLVCLICYKLGRPGINKEPGLVALRDANGWRILKLET